MSVRRRTVLGAGLTAVPVLASGVARAGEGTAPRVTDPGSYISFSGGAFSLVGAPVVVSAEDHPSVVRVAGDLRDDVERVTGVRPGSTIARSPVLVGTIGRSPLVDGLIASGRLDVSGVRGRWETSLQTVVDHPMPGVERAFVIAGSDPRGTIFGAYDVSYGIGVSHLVLVGRRAAGAPRPGVGAAGPVHAGHPGGEVPGHFHQRREPGPRHLGPGVLRPGQGARAARRFNADFYAKVFEVLLRLKGNHLWPAVWGRAFAEDDPENHRRADDYGVVMGTSHEAPMMRGSRSGTATRRRATTSTAAPASGRTAATRMRSGGTGGPVSGAWSTRASRASAVRAATGRSPGRLLIEARVYQAQRLLTDLPVRQVAVRVGITDPAYFCRFFRRETGSSPGDWRKHHSRHHQSIEAPGTRA